MAKGKHPVTFRTRKLSSSAPMVLHRGRCGRVGRRRTIFQERPPFGVAFSAFRTLFATAPSSGTLSQTESALTPVGVRALSAGAVKIEDQGVMNRLSPTVR